MRYLTEAEYAEGMNVFYTQPNPEPHHHTIWNGDFMGMCAHDIACPVCFDAYAVIERNVTPGQWSQTVQPCHDCQAKDWRVQRPWWKRIFARGAA